MDSQAYFQSTPEPACIPLLKVSLTRFINQFKHDQPIVFITSGGTTVPLEEYTVRYLDNFSAGTRGSVSAEYFLRNGYVVIFMHRQYSLRPFSRHFTHTKETVFDLLSVSSTGLIEVKQDLATNKIITEFNQYKSQLFQIEFNTVQEYLFLLKECIPIVEHHAGSYAMYYLAAAVSDFYIPACKLKLHKHQVSTSHTQNLELSLDPVPKLLRTLGQEWAPSGYVVSFKLETDPSLLDQKSKSALVKYGHHLVIGNILHTRKYVVYYYTWRKDNYPRKRTKDDIQCDPIELDNDEQLSGLEIEFYMVQRLVALHRDWYQSHTTTN